MFVSRTPTTTPVSPWPLSRGGIVPRWPGNFSRCLASRWVVRLVGSAISFNTWKSKMSKSQQIFWPGYSRYHASVHKRENLKTFQQEASRIRARISVGQRLGLHSGLANICFSCTCSFPYLAGGRDFLVAKVIIETDTFTKSFLTGQGRIDSLKK